MSSQFSAASSSSTSSCPTSTPSSNSSILYNGLKHLFSPHKQACFVPPFFTCTIDAFLSLQLIVQFHSISLIDNKDLHVITFQSRGFSKLNQNELMFIVEYHESSMAHEGQFQYLFDQFCAFLKHMYWVIQSNANSQTLKMNQNYFHSKRLTLFRNEKFLSIYRAFIYTNTEVPYDIERPQNNQPYSVIIGLSDQDYQFVSQFGISRFLALQGKANGLFPFRPFNCLLNNEYNRLQLNPSSSNSLLSTVYQITSVPDIFVRRDQNGCIHLEICEDSHQILVNSLYDLIRSNTDSQQEGADGNSLPPNFAVHCDLGHPAVFSHLVFPCQEGNSEVQISKLGCNSENNMEVGGSFCAFYITANTPTSNSIAVGSAEDGFCVTCTPTVWNQYLYKALVEKHNTNFWNQVTKQLIFSIRWVNSRYMTYRLPTDLQLPGNAFVRIENSQFHKRFEKKLLSLHLLAPVSTNIEFAKRFSLTGQKLLTQALRSHFEKKFRQSFREAPQIRYLQSYNLKLFIQIPENECRMQLFVANEDEDQPHVRLLEQIIDEINSATFSTTTTSLHFHMILKDHIRLIGPSISFITIFHVSHKYLT